MLNPDKPPAPGPQAVDASPAELGRLLKAAQAAIGEVILGKERQIKLALACLVARGHLLIEDLPGVGKTTLAQTIARVLGLEFQRIQFTSDLLPADVLGLSVFNRDSGGFEFHAGPIFSNLILADEVNRATPKTQSALLEAMEEHQATVEGETRPLPEPFFVIATQNPAHQIGTFPLPESQLDRFLLRIDMGYPGEQAERKLLSGADRRDILDTIERALEPERLRRLQRQARALHAAEALLDYIQAILAFSRTATDFEFGLSPRGGLALLNAARAWALLSGHDFVLPEHVKAVLPAVANHRLPLRDGAQEGAASAAEIIVDSVPVP